VLQSEVILPYLKWVHAVEEVAMVEVPLLSPVDSVVVQ